MYSRNFRIITTSTTIVSNRGDLTRIFGKWNESAWAVRTQRIARMVTSLD